MTSPTRNTRPAPEVGPRCHTCGASRLDGQGAIRPLHGKPTCKRCRKGAMQLVKQQPQDYAFVDGELKRISEDPTVTSWTAQAQRMFDQITQALADLPVTLEPPLVGHGAVAVTLPSGYRWHIYPPHHHPLEGVCTFRLFTAQRRMLPPEIFYGRLAADPVAFAMELRDLVHESVSGDIAAYIEADEMNERSMRVEAELFDPQQLLEPGR